MRAQRTKGTGVWPLTSLRQSFLNGALTRLIDPDVTLRRQIVEFVSRGDCGLASGAKGDDQYERLWYAELSGAEEVAFEAVSSCGLKTKPKNLKHHLKVPHSRNQSPHQVQAQNLNR